MNIPDQKFKVIPNNKIEINTYVDGKGPLIILHMAGQSLGIHGVTK